MITYEEFKKVDIRLGKVIDAKDFPETRKPAIKLTIDFGPEIGIKKSSAQLIDAYTPQNIIGKFVMCVVNFPPKQVGPFISEVLTLGFKNTNGTGFILATPDKDTVELGDKIKNS